MIPGDSSTSPQAGRKGEEVSKRVLSSEQIDLLHHIELSEAGWRKKVIDQVCLSSLLLAKGSSTSEELTRTATGLVATSRADIVEALARLIGDKKANEISVGQFAASEAARSESVERRERAAAQEAAAASVWDRVVSEFAPGNESDLSWGWFNRDVLEPLIRVHGARTYELLAVGIPEDGAAPTALFDSLDERLRGPARRAVDHFLSSDEPAPRQHVLRQLHAHLLCMAAGLPTGSVEALQQAGRTIELKILLDTNFVFSLLHLHENPSNEAAEALMALLEKVKGRVNVTLYVTPLTIDEIRRTLTGHEAQLEKIQMTPKLGEIASGLDEEVSGFARRFFEAASKTKGRLTAKEYLGPYLENLTTILQAHGIQLYNANLDGLTVTQPVIDDIAEQQRIDEEIVKRNPKRRAKSYFALRHDVALWHLVSSRRPVRLDAPLEAVYWLATLDNRLISFDASKRSGLGAKVPVCVHPSVLVQMLQLWLPRSPQFDEAVLDSLRISLPRTFDSDSEEVSLKILRALSRYQDIDDIPAAALTGILLNTALRGRIKAENDTDVQAELVKDEIIQAAGTIRRMHEQEQERARQLEVQLLQERVEASAASVQAQAENDGRVSELASKIALEKSLAESLRNEKDTVEKLLGEERARRTASDNRVAKQSAQFQLSLVGLSLLAAAALGLWFLSRFHLFGGGLRVSVTAAALLLGVCLSISVWFGKSKPALANWVWLTRLADTEGWLWKTVIVGVALNLLASWLWI